MIKIVTDGTIGGTQIWFGDVDIAPVLTKMEWSHSGGRLVLASVQFPAEVEHVSRPIGMGERPLIMGNRKEIEAPR